MQKTELHSSWFYYQEKNSKEKTIFAKSKGVKNNRLLTVIETKKHIYT